MKGQGGEPTFPEVPLQFGGSCGSGTLLGVTMSNTVSSLIPSIEQRLAGWERLQFAVAHPEARRIRPTITISRQFGCEGFPLAEAVRVRMEAATGEPWGLFDKALIDHVAHAEGVPPRLLERLGDLSRALEALGLHGDQHLGQDAAFAKVAKYLVQIAQVGNAILVGRGGAILCRDLPNAFHFRLFADDEFRVKSLVDRFGLDSEEARAQVKAQTRAREKFISHQLGEDITDPRHYHAVFNNARQGVEVIADTIVALVRSAWAQPGVFREMGA